MSSNEINALITLIEDPDENIFSHVHKELSSYGERVIPQLEMYWGINQYGALFQDRVSRLIRSIKNSSLQKSVVDWKDSEECDLAEGLILLNKYQDPTVDELEIKRLIARMRQDIWLELNDSLTALEIVNIFNHIIFNVYGLKGNKNNHTAPQNSYVMDVLTSKRGNSISLGAIYRILAQSLEIPVYGISLPNHFLLAYIDENIIGEIDIDLPSNNGILFYINPFSNGTIIHKDEIDDFLFHLDLPKKVDEYGACDNVEIINRMIGNLIYSYTQFKNEDRVEELKALKAVFEEKQENTSEEK